MNTEFAYSLQMQIILMVISFAETFCVMYLLSNVTLAALNLSASRKQKAMFAFITGTLLYSVLIYGIFLLGGGEKLSPVFLLFFTTPNPVFGLIYYFTAQRIFKFSPVRSLKLISYVYLFWIVIKTINKIGTVTVFIQNEEYYNYLKDAIQQVTCLFIFFVIYKVTMSIIKRGHIKLSFTDNMFFNKKKELFMFFMKALFAFTIRFCLPLMLEEHVFAYILSFIILVMFIIINICSDTIVYYKQTIRNHESHISALFNGMEELRGIKHDFNSVLHTYSGYLELKEYERLEQYHDSLVSAVSRTGNITELTQKMHENPAIVTLLINKLEYAESVNVMLNISIKCELRDLYIDNVDAARVLSCLLDNAVEAACCSKQRKVYITMESKAVCSKLIIITNSTDSEFDLNMLAGNTTTKEGHDGIGLSIVRKTLAKYGNCTFQMRYYNNEISVYVELKGSMI